MMSEEFASMSMKIFELSGDINFVPIRDDARVTEMMERQEPKRKGEIWGKVSLTSLKDLAKKGTPLGDCPYYGAGTLLASEKLKELIKQFAKDEVEFLPVEIDGDSGYWYVNVLCVLDALDEEQSELKRFPSTGRIMYVVRAKFRDAVVDGHHIFRLTNYGGIYITEALKRHIEHNLALGVKFRDTAERVENPFAELFDKRKKRKTKRDVLQ